MLISSAPRSREEGTLQAGGVPSERPVHDPCREVGSRVTNDPACRVFVDRDAQAQYQMHMYFYIETVYSSRIQKGHTAVINLSANTRYILFVDRKSLFSPWNGITVLFGLAIPRYSFFVSFSFSIQ